MKALEIATVTLPVLIHKTAALTSLKFAEQVGELKLNTLFFGFLFIVNIFV